MAVLAGYLRDKMAERGWSQSQLAGKAQISESALSHLLNKPDVLPRPETLQRLAAALEVQSATLTALTGYAVEGSPKLNERQMRLLHQIHALPWLERGIEQWLQLPDADQHDILNQIEYRLSRVKPSRSGQ